MSYQDLADAVNALNATNMALGAQATASLGNSNAALNQVTALLNTLAGVNGATGVGFDGGTVDDVLIYAKPLANYTALRNYSGKAVNVRLTQTGISGRVFRDDTVTTDDGGTTFLDGLGRGWRRLLQGDVLPSWFGAVPGASGNQSAAFIAAAAAAKAIGASLRFSGIYRLTETVDFREIPLFASDATFFLDTVDKIGVILGGHASQSWNPPQEMGKVFRTDESLTVPSVRVMGAKGQKLYIGRTHYLQLYASTSAPDRNRNYSIAYNTFNLGHINKLEFNTDPANAGGPANSETGGTIQWINENFIYINRCHGLLIDGSYTHNHNTIVGGSWEGPVTIDMNVGFHNQLLHARFEEGPTTVKFGVNAANCWLQKTWDGVIDDRQTGIISGTITDLGTANVVADDYAMRHNITCVAQASINDPWVNFNLELPARAPHLQRVGGSAGNAPVIMSDKIRIERNMQFYWTWTDYDAGDTVLYRPFMEFFDKNGVPINASTSWVLTPGVTTPSGNYLSTGTGVGSSNYWATIIQAALTAGAMFVRVGTRISSGQAANSVARNLAIYCGLPPTATYQGSVPNKRDMEIVVSSAPTQGFVPVGFTCKLNTGLSEYVCTFAFETTLTSIGAAASNTIVVAAATGVTVGDRVGINMDNRDTQWATVSVIAGTTLTLSTTLVNAAAIGSRVVFNRQITK